MGKGRESREYEVKGLVQNQKWERQWILDDENWRECLSKPNINDSTSLSETVLTPSISLARWDGKSL